MAIQTSTSQRTLARTGFASTIAAMLLVLLSVMFAAEAHAETRKLKLYFLHTGERAEITFKKNGKFVAGGLKKINRFLRDWRRNEPTKMDPRLLDLIWEVYQETGSKKYIHVVSAYRSPATNKLLRKRSRGVAKKSQHTLGKAMDYFIPGVNLRKLRNIGLRKGLGGVGYYPKSGSPFVHMDTGRVRHWPRMSRKELARVFPSGKTLHVPTDGKPLAKYNQAKAEYERKIKGKDRIVVAKAEEIKKRPNFFAKLLGKGEDEEGVISTVTAPRVVETTRRSNPKPANTLQPTQPVQTVATPAPEPALPEPALPEPVVETPETILASLSPDLIPVPVLAPRAKTEPEPQTDIVVAAITEPLGNEVPDEVPIQPRPELGLPEVSVDPETPEQQLAYAVPVPAIRPEFEQVVQTEISEPEIEEKPIRVAALSPGEIEDLRQEVYAVLAQKPADAAKIEQPKTTTFLIAEAGEFQNATATSELSLIPEPNPNRIAAVAIDKQIEELDPIEPGTKTTEVISVPEASPREPAESIEILVAALDPLEPGTKETGQLAIPAPNPEASQVAPKLAQVEGQKENSDVPIPLKAQRPILVAANEAKPANTGSRLETLRRISVEERLLGKWALAADTSIARIAEIRPPAYGKNIIRELPAVVLSRGFVQGTNDQSTSSFSGSSLEFLDFTSFN